MGARIAVVGPGAVGATVAAYLHNAGHPVVLCGRTPRDRLDVRPDGGDPVIVPGPVHSDPGEVNGPVELVVLAVKATQLDEAGRWLAVLCDEHTTVCVLQNGVEQVELVQPLCARSTVVPRDPAQGGPARACGTDQRGDRAAAGGGERRAGLECGTVACSTVTN